LSKLTIVGILDAGIGEGCVVGMGVSINGNGDGETNNVAVGTAICVSATLVQVIDTAVSKVFVGLVSDVDGELLQDVNIANTDIMGSIVAMIFMIPLLLTVCAEMSNGLRYWFGQPCAHSSIE
jgi:hypothetical protein